MTITHDALFAASCSPILNEVFGETVTLQRAASTTASVTASWISDAGRLESPDGSVTIVVDRVWLILKTAYLIGGVAVTPATGDRIVESSGTTWEVLPSIAGPAVISHGAGYDWELKTKLVV